jgi:Na+/H+ antiporter NhaD/arsenite permease-like protein
MRKTMIWFSLAVTLAWGASCLSTGAEPEPTPGATSGSGVEAAAAGHGSEAGGVEHGLDGSELGLWWGIPFVGILLSIALMPLVAPRFWHHHFGKVSLFWALCFLVPQLIQQGASVTLYEVLHVVLQEYLPFIILLFSLFTIAGGVRLTGRLAGTPMVNTVMLAIGTLAASVMGTTGAAMLMIRPFIRANEGRTKRVHAIVFFIFLVANVGGSLSPLGDPPLFLGFLLGVDFFWPTRMMLGPMMLVAGLLLAVFYVWDTLLYRKEAKPEAKESDGQPLRVEGKVNLLLLLGVVAAVLMSGIWKPEAHLPTVHGVHLALQNVTRDFLLLGLAGLSWVMTPRAGRMANGFSWFPIVEVAKLFIGIFMTIIPVIAILKAGDHGRLAGLIQLVSHDGVAINSMYFWLTGILSSFLDNAPTYLVFFNTAGGNATELMAHGTTLLAISAGAVFFGAITYIGNAPNFMVRSIAESSGIRMPSFFGYMLYSVAILVPLFILVTLIWFRESGGV